MSNDSVTPSESQHSHTRPEAATTEHGSASRTAEGSPVGHERSESLLYLYSNISIHDSPETLRKEQILALCGILAPYQKRQAHTLFLNVSRLIRQAPSVGHIGFFTLTTKDTTDKKEFSRRWNSMRSNYWNDSPNFGDWIGCFEQQKRGAWHLHILVVMPYDIRTGFDFEEVEKGRYRSAGSYLRSVWRELRGACLRYGFGRHELLPVRSNAEAMARYVGKYISKHIGQRDEEAKGKRLVTASCGWVKNSVRFAWNTPGAKEWRRKVALFAAVLGIDDPAGLYLRLGPTWAYKHLDTICNIDELVAGIERGVYMLKKGDLVNVRTGEILF